MQEQTLKSPTEYIKEAFRIYFKKENFVFFVKIMAVLAIIASLIGYTLSYYEKPVYDPFYLLFITLTVIAGVWMNTIEYYSLLHIGGEVRSVFTAGIRNMFKFFLISLTVGLIIFFGLVLLIIPGIIFAVWYSFAIWLVLDRGLKIGEALRTSKAMVSGRFWKILGRSVVFGLFSLLASIVFGAVPYIGPFVLSLISPLLMLPFYLLYQDISRGGLDNLGTA